MKEVSIISIIMAIALIYSAVEFGYQIQTKVRFDTIISSFPEFNTLIFDNHLRKHMWESINHTIAHISTHLWLLCVVSCLASILSMSSAKKYILSKLKSALNAFTPFFGLTSFEILVLHVQCFTVRLIESKWIWDLFVPQGSPFNILWPIFVFSIWSPIEIRFKIFLEKKLHYKASIVLAILHASATAIYPLLRLAYSLVFQSSKILNFNADITKFIPALRNASMIIIPSKSHHLQVISTSFFGKDYFIVEGHHGSDLTELSNYLMFESYNFSLIMKMYNFIAPFMINMIFAGLAIFLSKRYLKRFHLSDIDHVTVYLVLEEFFNLGFFQYLQSPFKTFENKLILQNDNFIKEYLSTIKNRKEVLSRFLNQEIHSHKNIFPSPLSLFINSTINPLRRIETILAK